MFIGMAMPSQYGKLQKVLIVYYFYDTNVIVYRKIIMAISKDAIDSIKQQLSNLSESDIAAMMERRHSAQPNISFAQFEQIQKEWRDAVKVIQATDYVVAKKEFYHPLRFLDADVQLFAVTKIIEIPRLFTEHFSDMDKRMPSVYSSLHCDLELLGIDDDGELMSFCYSSKLMRVATAEQIAVYKEKMDNHGEVCSNCGKIHDDHSTEMAKEEWNAMINIGDENEFITKLIRGNFKTAVMASTMAARHAREKFDKDANGGVAEMAMINQDIVSMSVNDRNQHAIVIAGCLVDNYNRTVVLMDAQTHARYLRLINHFSKERKD